MSGEDPLPLSARLFTKAQEYADQAGNKELTGKKATKDASMGIGTMLAQLNQTGQSREYSRIKNKALLISAQLAREKGPAEAAKYLHGHAIAAQVLETLSIMEFSFDKTKLMASASSVAEQIKEKLK